MNVEIFTVCEYAYTLGSTINVLNTFDTLTNDKLPMVKSFAIALRLRYEPEDEGDKIITYRIFDPNGEKIIGDIKASTHIESHKNRSRCINLVVNAENMVFEKKGKYRVCIETEGVEFEAPIYIDLLQQA